MGNWYTLFKALGMKNLQYEMRIIKSQRQFKYGSIFYESDVVYDSDILIVISDSTDHLIRRFLKNYLCETIAELSLLINVHI